MVWPDLASTNLSMSEAKCLLFGSGLAGLDRGVEAMGCLEPIIIGLAGLDR